MRTALSVHFQPGRPQKDGSGKKLEIMEESQVVAMQTRANPTERIAANEKRRVLRYVSATRSASTVAAPGRRSTGESERGGCSRRESGAKRTSVRDPRPKRDIPQVAEAQARGVLAFQMPRRFCEAYFGT
ncbi:hypothetical protein DMP07_05400 [Slackia faecicanis]|uniref:Uncharacterized protein n=1 Tax=Slackia faecicanis TaxID=255723 RepID=A0A3N0AEX0_9ACTN|nr:hypothetical protein DMP07_05400 [Slackia faecicanis]